MRQVGETRLFRMRTVHALWERQPGLFRGYLADVITALSLGTLLIVGGYQRTHAPAWGVVNANGGPVVWGAVFLTGGALLVLASATPNLLMVVTLWLLALMYLVLALSFLVSVLSDPTGTGSFIGALLAGRASFMHVSRAQAYREDPRWTV